MDAWNTIVSFWDGLFSGAMLVLGRVLVKHGVGWWCHNFPATLWINSTGHHNDGAWPSHNGRRCHVSWCAFTGFFGV